MGASPPVSVVVPTLNGGDLLRRLLEGVSRQNVDYTAPVIAIDSGSTDDTVRLLHDFGVHVLEIPRGQFDHGETRNAALRAVSTDVAVLMAQDAVPASDGWLGALVEPLLRDHTIAGTYARQQAWPQASRITRHYLAQWAASRPAPRVVGPLDAAAIDQMTPVARHETCVFDNVCSCVRMSVWRALPFRRTPIAEDLEWGLEVLRAGHRLAYVPDAVVWHSHERPPAYELRRTYLVHQRLHALFGLSTIPDARALVRSLAAALPLHLRLAAAESSGRPRAMLRAAGLAVAMPLGQYLGGRSARTGRRYLPQGGI